MTTNLVVGCISSLGHAGWIQYAFRGLRKAISQGMGKVEARPLCTAAGHRQSQNDGVVQ